MTDEDVMPQPEETRRDQIAREAAKLFAHKGYERANLQELAALLGVTKPALYYHFRSKEELLFAIMSFVMDRVLGDISDIRASGLAPLEQLREWTRRYIGFFALHPAELTLMSTAVDSLTGERRDEILERQRQYTAHGRAIVRAVLADVPGRHPHETSVVFALLGGMNWIFKWYDPEGGIPPGELADDFYRVFTQGLVGVIPGETPDTGR